MKRALAVLSIAVGASSASGLLACGATCDRTPDVEPTVFEGGTTDLEGGFYETSSWEGPYLDFPAGRTYLLIHRLGGLPRDVWPYLSFNDGTVASRAPGAGNQAQIEKVTDEYIRIRNDTCSDIHLRVTASNVETQAPPPDGGP